MVRLGPNTLIVRPIWTLGPLNAAWSMNVSHRLRCLNSRVTSKKKYKQVPAEPSLAGFGGNDAMAPAETLSRVPGGPYTVFLVESLAQLISREFQIWCCHVLATMAGLASSHCVDDVLAVDRRTTIFSGWLVWRVLAACCGWVVPDVKSPLPSQVHRILGATSDLSQTPSGPPTLSISQDRVSQLTCMVKDVLESGHLHPATAGKLWERLGCSWQANCGVGLAGSKLSSVFTSPT